MKKPFLSRPSAGKPRFFVLLWLFFYAFLSEFIAIESCLPGPLSAEQSDFVGGAVAAIVNVFAPSVEARMVEPLSLTLASDSTYLAPVGGRPQVGVGTTTRIIYETADPSMGKGEYLDPYFSVARNDGTSESDGLYNLIVEDKTVYIVSVGVPRAGCSLRVEAGGGLSAIYSFDIVDLPAPPEGIYEVSAPSLSLRQGETATLSLSMADEAKGKDDAYLRRYYDPRKLPRSSSDETVATIDEYGVIRGIGEGEAAIAYGSFSFAAAVAGRGDLPDASTRLTIAKADASESLSLNDYDFPDAEGSRSGVLLNASIAGTLPSDHSLTWRVIGADGQEDLLLAKILQLADGSAEVKGYRKKGTARIEAYLNCDPAIKASIDLAIGEVTPVTMGLLADGKAAGADGEASLSSFVSGKIVLEGSFAGPSGNPNIANKSLNMTSGSDLLAISGNGTPAITVSFVREGTAEADVLSVANPALAYHLVFTIASTPYVDPSEEGFAVFIRKFIGHGTLFALSSFCGFFFLSLYLGDRKGLASSLGAFGNGALLAALTELIQHFVPGRTGSFTDIGFDVLGTIAGILLAYLIFFFLRLAANRREKGAAAAPR